MQFLSAGFKTFKFIASFGKQEKGEMLKRHFLGAQVYGDSPCESIVKYGLLDGKPADCEPMMKKMDLR